MKTSRNVLLFLHATVAGILFVSTVPSPAQVAQILYDIPTTPARDNYTGVIGCEFQVGSSNVVVSHLGFFDYNNDGLTVSHNVAVFSSTLAAPTILGMVTVPSGTGAYLTNGFRWMQLDPPLLLQSNSFYVVAGMVGNGDGDTWQDIYSPTWNTYFVGAAATTTRHGIYGPGNSTWPPTGLSQYTVNSTYGNISLGYIEVGQARVGVQTTNVSISAGSTLTVLGFGTGQQPISYQWYLANGTPVSGQTNASLVIPNATTGNRTYYITATNALGGEQSANVAVSVTAIPVGISQQPTNMTVFANYSASFFTTATGTPPISYQWSRNGVAIPGATSTGYSITANQTNNGDIYSCFVSNSVSGTPETATTSNATLTVLYNLALPPQYLHGAVSTNISQNGYVGSLGGSFVVGDQDVIVTHLGYYAYNYTDATHATLIDNHAVTIWNADYSVNTSIVVSNGTGLPVINGYIWAPLNSPVTLTHDTTYILGADTTANDPWGNTYIVQDWSSYFTNPTNSSSFLAAYNASGSAPYYGGYAGQMYSAPNMAILAPNTPAAFVTPTVMTQYVGLNVTLSAIVDGQAPVTLQWYKAPSTLLANQTNLTLNLSNLSLGDSGNYYVIANNSVGGVQSGNATLTVIPDTGPSITQDIQSQSAFVYQTVQFVAGASGTPPLSYQWTFNGNVIPGANNSTLTLSDVSSANVGSYQLVVTNNYGHTNSSTVNLAVQIPAWGSYPSGVMGTNLLAYYRFSDVNSGLGIATNQGSLGSSCNATYEGGYSGAAGPTTGDFEPGNLAVSLDGFTGDVLVPPLDNIVVSNITIAAWVYDAGGQPANTAIFFHRQSDVFGLTISPDPNTSVDELGYTWNGTYNSFVSGLDLPVNTWVFTALVINPTNATLYLQDGTGMKSTNNAATYTASAFTGGSYIGWDTAGGATGRRWTGPIDEVMVFNQALSPVAINALYLGVPASATITIAPSGSNRVLTWPGGALQEAANLNGPWMTDTGATSPYTITPSATQKFYRVKLQ